MKTSSGDEVDVKGAALLAGRTAETIRRWVWSGRLRAHKRGNRLVMARRDVEALARGGEQQQLSLSEWAKLAEAALRSRRGPYKSAVDLVIEERRRRLDDLGGHGSR